MKYFAKLLPTLLVCYTCLAGQAEENDPYSMHLVQNNLQIAQTGAPGGLGSTAKHFQRLGDGVSIALLKILDEQQLADPRTVEAFLPLIRESFSYPSIISIEINKKPSVTLFLLTNLQRNISDLRARQDIKQTIDFVRQKTNGLTTH